MSENSENIIRVEFPEGPRYIARTFEYKPWEGELCKVYRPVTMYGFDFLQQRDGSWIAEENHGGAGSVIFA